MIKINKKSKIFKNCFSLKTLTAKNTSLLTIGTNLNTYVNIKKGK